MFRQLPYINITLGMLYFILYLQQGSWYPVLGILMIVLCAALELTQGEHPQWVRYLIVYPAAMVSALFAGFLVFSSIHILLDAIDHAYYPASMIFLFAFSLLFSFFILCSLTLRYLFN
jgi:hypothetical protein